MFPKLAPDLPSVPPFPVIEFRLHHKTVSARTPHELDRKIDFYRNNAWSVDGPLLASGGIFVRAMVKKEYL